MMVATAESAQSVENAEGVESVEIQPRSGPGVAERAKAAWAAVVDLKKEPSDAERLALDDAMTVTVQGVAAGMQNTG